MVPSSSRVGSMTIYSMVRPSDSLTLNTGRASGSTLRTFSIAHRSYSVTRPSALSVVIWRHIPLRTPLQHRLRCR